MSSKSKFVWLFVLIFSISLVAIGCGGSSTDKKAADNQPKAGNEKPITNQSKGGSEKPIVIGMVGPFTGPNADYGKGLIQGAEIAAEEWNAKGGLLGREIKLVKGDDQGDSKQATTVANKFVSQGVDGVIGATFSNSTIAANPIFEQAKIVAVSGVSSAHKINELPGSSYFFRVIPDDEQIAQFAAAFLKDKLGAQKIAYINDGTAYTTGAVAAIKKEAEKSGLTTVFDEAITPGEPDYTAIITKIKAVSPDVIIGGTYSPEGGLIQKQATEAKLAAKIIFIMGNQNPTFAEVASKEKAKGALTVDYPTPNDVKTASAFVAKIQEKYKEKPDTYAHYWYDAANALFRGIAAAGTTEGPKVKEALLKMTPFEGATGTVTFTEKKNRKEFAFIIKEFNGSGWVPYTK